MLTYAMTAIRSYGWVLRVDARLVSRALFQWVARRFPTFVRFAVWSAVAVTLGMIVGLAAIVLPPTGVFGLVALAGLALLWALPDLPAVPARSVRLLFVVVLVVDLCVPNYYAVQFAGLPWITMRRLATFPLIVAIALCIAGSSQVRHHLGRTIGSTKLMSFCIIGFYVSILLSILSSASPFESLSGAAEASLTWYVPWLALLFVIKDEADLLKLLRMIGWCAIVVSLAGVLEFILQHRYFVDIIPKPLLSGMMENNPSFAAMVNMSSYRNGMYRASSIFTVPLSFGEFEAMIAPFGYTFFLHEQTTRGRTFGLAIVLSSFAAILVSGARGAYMAFLISSAVFIALWVARKSRFDRRSLAPATAVVAAVMSFAVVILLILFWTRAHNMVLGGGMEAYSDQGRYDEWNLALPKIIQNPVTGHGFDVGAGVVGYFTPGGSIPTLDSYVISLLVETGIPGFLLFFGAIAAGVWSGVREYLSDGTERGGLAGGLACALLAYAIYRLVLSQQESQTLLYLFIGALMALARVKRDQHENETNRRVSGSPRSQRPDNHVQQ